MANITYTITEFAMYLVRTGRAKDATVAGKRVRSALRANKAAMGKVDANVKRHQKGASYMPLNNASAKVLANALNITNVSAIKGTQRKRKSVKKADTPVVVAPSAQDNE
jgi:Zn-finger domain-containing protein